MTKQFIFLICTASLVLSPITCRSNDLNADTTNVNSNYTIEETSISNFYDLETELNEILKKTQDATGKDVPDIISLIVTVKQKYENSKNNLSKEEQVNIESMFITIIEELKQKY